MSNGTPERRLRWDAVAVIVALALAAGNIVATNWYRFERDEEEVWKRMETDVTHEAESDGFVVAYAHGNRPYKEAVFHEGPARDNTVWRARISQHNSMTIPVRKGRFWRVESVGTGGGPTVFWTDSP